MAGKDTGEGIYLANTTQLNSHSESTRKGKGRQSWINSYFWKWFTVEDNIIFLSTRNKYLLEGSSRAKGIWMPICYKKNYQKKKKSIQTSF